MFIDRIYDFTQKTIRKARTADPYELAEQLGITVKYKSFGDLKGTYFISKRQPFIILNDTLDEVMERVVLAHEIGHHLLHRHIAVGNFQEFGYFDMTSKPEKEANLFAANFLITDEDVISLAEEQYTSEQASCILKVPHQLILIKMEDMNKRGYGTWMIAPEYENCGFVRTDKRPTFYGEGFFIHTRWTHKGAAFLYNRLKENGILPIFDWIKQITTTN